MTFDEQCEAIMEQIKVFLTDISMGLTDERKAALKRMRELGLKPEHVDQVFAISEQLHAQQLAQAEARLASSLGDTH
jgi:hypothetical protein